MDEPKVEVRTLTDSLPLMNQIAAMARIPEGRARRMVLVLGVRDMPVLYWEGFLSEKRVDGVPLPPELKAVGLDGAEGVLASEESPVAVSTGGGLSVTRAKP